MGLFFTQLGGPRSVKGKHKLWLGYVSLRNKPGLQFWFVLCVPCPSFIWLRSFFATSRNQLQIIVAAKKKTALSASLFQPMVKNWGGASHLNTRNKSSKFRERMNLVHSLCKILLDSVDYKLYPSFIQFSE